MASHGRTIPFTIIIVINILLSLTLCCNGDFMPDNIYIDDQEEYGYDFKGYPSYFGTIEDNMFLDPVKAETSGSGSFFDLMKKGNLEASAKLVNVENFGAKGDGSTDDTVAFKKAWDVACSSSVATTFVVPKNKNYLLKPIRFMGPCKSNLVMQIYGTIEASGDRSDYEKDLRHWLLIGSVQNLVIEGGGIINGNGKIWWQNSCKINKALPCKNAPTAITMYQCNNLIMKNLKIENGQQMHVSFEKCVNVEASNLMVNSPQYSPNTDGIHVANTQNILISNTVIATGDDCISIENGSQRVQALDITCGPGHGISIGSLGSGNSKAYVSDVTVSGAKLIGTTNGVRIKTWQGGSGSASNIKFQNIDMQNVTNPIIIDQNYCDQDEPCKQQGSAVQVKNVVYQNIKGTSASEVAIKLDCSKSFPCEGIVLQDINIVSRRGSGPTKALCNNVHFSQRGAVLPHCP
ncbi:hypothetical protein LguiA_014427 [Lonicera macranthoides]